MIKKIFFTLYVLLFGYSLNDSYWIIPIAVPFIILMLYVSEESHD